MEKQRKRPPRPPTTIRFNDAERAWINARADAERCPMSEVVRGLVQRGMAGKRKK